MKFNLQHRSLIRFPATAIFFLAGLIFVAHTAADDWPHWRGPDRNDQSAEKGALAYADGLFYHVQEDDGQVLLFSADETGVQAKGAFTLTPQTERRDPKGRIWVHPVISNGKLYLRDQEIIYCYDIKK